MEVVKAMPFKTRRLGRPRAIPEDIELTVVSLYEHGYAYRAIARILNTPEYGSTPCKLDKEHNLR